MCETVRRTAEVGFVGGEEHLVGKLGDFAGDVDGGHVHRCRPDCERRMGCHEGQGRRARKDGLGKRQKTRGSLLTRMRVRIIVLKQ